MGDNGNWFVGSDDTGKPSRGEKGEPGSPGAKGDKGDPGATPNLTIGSVTTLDAGQNATASMGGTAESPVLNLGIPRGAKGEPGEGGGGTDISLGLTSAAVGQTIKVKAIDASGKPTAWDAADFPSGGGGVETAFTLIDSGVIEDGTVSLEFGALEKYSEITCCFSLIRNNNNLSSGVSLYVNGFNIVSGGNYFIVYNQETYPTISIKKVSENRILCMANGAGLNNPHNVNPYFNSIHPIPNNETELRSIKIAISKSGVTFTAGSTFELWGR